jgi:hypothetical protein
MYVQTELCEGGTPRTDRTPNTRPHGGCGGGLRCCCCCCRRCCCRRCCCRRCCCRGGAGAGGCCWLWRRLAALRLLAPGPWPLAPGSWLLRVLTCCGVRRSMYGSAGTLREAISRFDLTALAAATDVWRVVRQVASGLSHIHTHGMIHCDLKPDNILITRDGACKVGDLGQATCIANWDEQEVRQAHTHSTRTAHVHVTTSSATRAHAACHSSAAGALLRLARCIGHALSRTASHRRLAPHRPLPSSIAWHTARCPARLHGTPPAASPRPTLVACRFPLTTALVCFSVWVCSLLRGMRATSRATCSRRGPLPPLMSSRSASWCSRSYLG